MAGSAWSPAGRDATIVAGLTVLALVLRLAGAGGGLWIDEIYSLVDSFRQPLATIVTTFHHDNHHPFYAVLARLTLVMAGESPFAIRLPAILVGTVSVPLLWKLARRVTGSREALAAAALLAVSYHHVWFSQNARGYAILAAGTILGSALLLDLLQRDGGLRQALGYGLVAAVGAYTHLTMVFVVVGHAVGYAVGLLLDGDRAARGRRARLGATAFLAAATLTLAFYAPMLAQVVDHFLNRPSGLRGVSTPLWALVESLRILALGFGAGTLILGGLVVAAGAGVFASGLLSYARRQPAALALFIAPGLTILAGALAARGTMYPRFFFALAGPALLIVCRGVAVVADRAGARFLSRPDGATILARTAFAALLLLSLGSLVRNYRYPKQDFEGAVRWLEATRPAAEPALTAGVASFALRDYLRRNWPEVGSAEALAERRREGPVWLVWTFPRYLSVTDPALMATLERECAAARAFPGTVGGGDVNVCRLEALP